MKKQWLGLVTAMLAWLVAFVALLCVAGLMPSTPALAVGPDAAPTIAAVTPESAPNDLETSVVITGTGFAPVPTVTLGSTLLDDVGWVSAERLTATVPWGLEPGVYTVTVENSGGESGSLAGAFTVTQGIGVWTTGGPYGGQANFIAQHPVDPQLLYAAAQWVGIFGSEDSGESWQPILAIQWPTRLQFDAGDPDVIYVSGDSGDFFKTTDGGDTWEPIPELIHSQNGCFAVYAAAHPATAGVIYAGVGSCAGIPLVPGEGGVFYSDDYGQTWITRTHGLTDTDVIDLAFDPADPDQLLLATMSGNIFATTDGGQNWSWQAKIDDGLRRIYFSPHIAGQYWAIPLHPRFGGSEPQHSLYRSTDVTAWDGVDLPSGAAEVWNLSFEPGGIWAAAHFGFFSDDGGDTWSEVMANQPSSGGLADFVVDAGDPNVIYAGAQERAFFKSIDGGASWNVSNTGLAALNPRDVVASNVEPDTVYANIDGFELIRSYNGGSTWQGLGVRNGGGGQSGRFLALDPFTPLRVYYEQGCTADGPCFWYSADAGDSWDEVLMPVPVTYTGWISRMNLIAPHPLVSGTLYATVHFAQPGSEEIGIYRSLDYGQSWSYLDAGLAISNVRDIAFDSADPDLLYVTTAGSGLWRSTDGGEQWAHVQISDIQPPVTVPAIATHPDVAGKLYVRTYSYAESPNPEPELWVSEDAGNTWQPMAYVFLGIDLLVAPPLPDAPPYTLYTGCQPGLCRSVDDGQSWIPVEGAPRPEILTAASDGERTVIYLGTPGGLVAAAGSVRTAGAQVRDTIPGRGSVLGGGVYRYTSLLGGQRVYLPLVMRAQP